MKLSKRNQLKYKICISGAADTGHCAADAPQKAEELGREIARRGMVLVTGATVGIPYWAAKGAKEEGGMVIGLSPAASEAAHVKTYKLPTDYHDIIVYTGFEYSGRNLLLTRSADAIINVCGRMGTLNEFTIAFEDQKPIGVLEGTGGTADELRGIIGKMHRGPGKVVFSKDIKELLDKVVAEIEMEKKNKDGNRYVRG
ncbi:MAG: LOG family protein [Patescibacteria group bacterium]|nr:LOG family protein [Patescibacteria group bacterium]